MNIHIEFVKEYLTNNGCKTQKELNDNASAAYVAYRASIAAATGSDKYAAQCVKEYEGLTK